MPGLVQLQKYQIVSAVSGVVAAFAAAMLPVAAHASLISIGDSLNSASPVTTLATDGGTGFVQASGSVGAFTVTSATATGYPALPQPTLDTSSLDVTSSAAGTLYMYITEQGLTSPQGISSFLSSFTTNLFNGGVGISSVTEKTFIGATNALYGGTLLSSYTDSAGGLTTSAQTASSPFLSGPFSETIEYIINTNGAGSTNDTVNLQTVAVPEPATFGIFGLGLGMMALIARRRRSV